MLKEFTKIIGFPWDPMGPRISPTLAGMSTHKPQFVFLVSSDSQMAVTMTKIGIDAVKIKVRSTGRLRALDSRPIFCRAEHAALNYLLQSAGAILSKRWVCVSQDLLDAEGLTYNRDYTRCAYVHDEQQLSVLPSEAERVAELLVRAAPIAGQYYKFKVPITAASDIGPDWASTH